MEGKVITLAHTETGEVQYFESRRAAATFLGVDRSRIMAKMCCRGWLALDGKVPPEEAATEAATRLKPPNQPEEVTAYDLVEQKALHFHSKRAAAGHIGCTPGAVVPGRLVRCFRIFRGHIPEHEAARRSEGEAAAGSTCIQVYDAEAGAVAYFHRTSEVAELSGVTTDAIRKRLQRNSGTHVGDVPMRFRVSRVPYRGQEVRVWERQPGPLPAPMWVQEFQAKLAHFKPVMFGQDVQWVPSSGDPRKDEALKRWYAEEFEPRETEYMRETAAFRQRVEEYKGKKVY